MLCLDQADGKVLWQKDADFKIAEASGALIPFIFSISKGRIAFYATGGSKSTLAYFDLKTGAMVKGPTVPKSPIAWTDDELFTGGSMGVEDGGFMPDAVPGGGGVTRWGGFIPMGGSIYRLRPWPLPESSSEKE